MNVGFCVSMTPRRLLCFAGKFNLPKIVSRMEALAAQRGCGIERREEDIAVHFCPEGDLVFHPDEEAQTLKGSADSSIAGPGFHAAAATSAMHWPARPAWSRFMSPATLTAREAISKLSGARCSCPFWRNS